MNRLSDERSIFVLLAIILVFMLINFNEQLGIIFISMGVIDFLIYLSDKRVTLKTESRTDNRFESILWGIIGYGVFIFSGSVLVNVLQGGLLTKFFGTVLGAQSASIPALSESVFLTIAAWGIVIPIIETRFFFGRMMEFSSEILNIDISKNGLRQIKTWILFVLISAIFTIFHLTAKATQGNAALILTFVFGMVSCIMAVYFQELKQAINMHIISNTLAVLNKYGLLKGVGI